MEDNKTTKQPTNKRGRKPKTENSENINEQIKETSEQTLKEEIIEKPKQGRISDRFKKQTFSTIDINTKRKVPVMSLVSYPVGYQCKLSPLFLIWTEYGNQHEMTIEEINMMNSESNDFLHEPMLIVDDEEFAEVYGLMDLYERIFELEDLDDFYSQRPQVIQKKIDLLSKGARKNLFLRTIKMIKQGKLSNLSVLRLLRDTYGLEIEI